MKNCSPGIQFEINREFSWTSSVFLAEIVNTFTVWFFRFGHRHMNVVMIIL
jgi:hypothetical protein